MAQIILFPNTRSTHIDNDEYFRAHIYEGTDLASDWNQDIYLSNNWRVIDDGTQWLIQLKKSNGWKTKSHCITRDELLEAFMKYGAPASPDSIAMVRKLPPTYQFGSGREGSPS